MTYYEVKVLRDGRFWMVMVPEIEEVTQARNIREIPDMARELISLKTGEPTSDISINTTSITIPGRGDINPSLIGLMEIREETTKLVARTKVVTTHVARDLTNSGLTIRDTAALIGLSPSRVSELIREPTLED
jgi:hypothetical protein